LPDESPALFGYRPYTLFKNDALLEKGVTDAYGFVTIDKADLDARYAVELSNGARFDLSLVQAFADAQTLAGIEHRLSNQGVRADGQSTKARYEQQQRGNSAQA
jgi:type VI secretion system secreted protein VgrG